MSFRSHCRSALTATLALAIVGLASAQTTQRTGGNAATAPTSRPVPPRQLVLLIDASGSMLSVMPTVQRAAISVIDGLQPEDRFTVFVFANNTRILVDGYLDATDTNKQRARKFVSSITAAGGTKYTRVVEAAFRIRPAEMYVFTDGFDQGDPKQAPDLFRRLNAAGETAVHTVLAKGSEDSELREILEQIARQNGGTFRELNRPSP